MIFSIHIPKTAGTSFRFALEARYGARLALYYGVKDPKTTEGLRVQPKHLAAAAAELPARGFEVLHGHYAAADIAPLLESPSDVWTWLRDPVERTISHYEFYRQRPLELKPLAQKVKSGETTFADFVGVRQARNVQTRRLRGLDLSDLGFVGISEHFDLGLSLLFGENAPKLELRYNATERETEVSSGERLAIARANIRDTQLYAEALRLFIGRVAKAHAAAPDAADEPGFMARLLRAVS